MLARAIWRLRWCGLRAWWAEWRWFILLAIVVAVLALQRGYSGITYWR